MKQIIFAASILGCAFSNFATADDASFSSQSSTISAKIQAKPIEAVEMTLSIIKPDAVKNNHIGNIISRFEKAQLRIAAIKMVKLSKEQAGQFYGEHKGKPFYEDLINFISSGPVVVLVLEGDQAISKNRQIMGATDPKKAEQGTIRSDLAESMSKNAVHGSDSPEAAAREIGFFFFPDEINQRF